MQQTTRDIPDGMRHESWNIHVACEAAKDPGRTEHHAHNMHHAMRKMYDATWTTQLASCTMKPAPYNMQQAKQNVQRGHATCNSNAVHTRMALWKGRGSEVAGGSGVVERAARLPALAPPLSGSAHSVVASDHRPFDSAPVSAAEAAVRA